MFVLFDVIISFVIGFIDSLAGLNFSVGGSAVGILTVIYSLFILIPTIAVSVRRMHDIGKSGWVILLSLIPLVGSIIILVYLCRAGMPGDNAYGTDPKAQEA